MKFAIERECHFHSEPHVSEYFLLAHHKNSIYNNKSIHIIKGNIFSLSPVTNRKMRSNEDLHRHSSKKQIINMTIKSLI